MKIIDSATFLALPAGTIYSKYSPCNFGGLSIKYDSIKNRDGVFHDFYYASLNDAIQFNAGGDFYDILESAKMDNMSMSMDFEAYSRDGLFVSSQLYAIWEKHDVRDLITKLQTCYMNAFYPNVLPKPPQK